MPNELKELEIPPSIFSDDEPKGIEFVRFWICDSNDHVTLNIGGMDPDAEARQWGYIMADIAKHAVRGMQQDDPSRGTPEMMLAEIERGFFERLENQGLKLSGELRVNKQ